MGANGLPAKARGKPGVRPLDGESMLIPLLPDLRIRQRDYLLELSRAFPRSGLENSAGEDSHYFHRHARRLRRMITCDR